MSTFLLAVGTFYAFFAVFDLAHHNSGWALVDVLLAGALFAARFAIRYFTARHVREDAES